MTIPEDSRFEDTPDQYLERQLDKNQSQSLIKLNFNWFYYFNYGMIWGVVLATIAIASASIGAALTTIPAVNNIIVTRLNQNKIATKLIRHQTTVNQIIPANLTRPINILVVGIKPNTTLESNYSSSAVVNKSSDILLWQLQPQQQLAKVTTIPGNSQIFIPRLGWSTIEEANTYGGVALVSQTINQIVEGVTIDRYIRATPGALAALTAITGDLVSECSAVERSQQSYTNAVEKCTTKLNKFQQQQIAIAALRQRLNNPEIISQISQAISQLSQYLDTNLSQSEMLGLANFLGTIPEKRLTVNLPTEYLQQPQKLGSNNNLAAANFEYRKKKSSVKMRSPEAQSHPFHNIEIAIQNTTKDPDLALEAIAYLKQHNFQNVYLVNYLPLELEQTEIILPQSKISSADYIRQNLGLGKLKLASDNSQEAILIRIGKDAKYLTIKDSFIR